MGTMSNRPVSLTMQARDSESLSFTKESSSAPWTWPPHSFRAQAILTPWPCNSSFHRHLLRTSYSRVVSVVSLKCDEVTFLHLRPLGIQPGLYCQPRMR